MKQKELAAIINTSERNVSRYIASGVIPGYGNKNEVIESEAIDALKKVGKLDKDNKFLSRKSKPFKAKTEPKAIPQPLLNYSGDVETSHHTKEELEDIALKQSIESEKRKAVDSYESYDFEIETTMGEFPDDLSSILLEIEDPVKRVQVIKDFWSGKIQRQKFMTEQKELMPINQAKAVIELLFHPISKRMDNFHIDLKSRFPEVQLEAIEWIESSINEMKQSIQEYQWGS